MLYFEVFDKWVKYRAIIFGCVGIDWKLFLEQNNAGTSSIDFTSEIVEEDTTNAGPSEQDTFTWENTSSALDWTSTTQNYTLSFDGLDGYELVYAVFSGNFNDLELTTVSSDPDEEDDVQNLVRN